MNRHTCVGFGQLGAGCALLAVAVGLSGCGIGEPTASSPVTMQGTFKGMVYGGQQPVVGAHVYLYAAGSGTGSSAYGGAGIAASSSNASVSLLHAASNTTSDGTNYYITTDAIGSFLLTGDYNCTAGQQLYVYVTGGNPGGGTNSAVGMMAIAGQCPLTTVPFIWVNEISTIAAAYSFAGFATDPTHVSSSSTNATGIANAFATAPNLVNVATGVARTSTVASNGAVPNLEIDTLANIISDCINTTGPTSTPCTTLFANAKSAGTTGTAATDTAGAAINLAHFPGVSSAQVTALYALQAGVATPFNSHLTSQPNDFTIVIKYTGGGLSKPWSITTDASGNVWTGNCGANVLTGQGPSGAFLTGSTGYTSAAITGSNNAIAVDPSGNVWTVNNPATSTCGNSVTQTSSSATRFAISSSAVTGSTSFNPSGAIADPGALSIDKLGNVWILNLGSLSELSYNSSNNTAAALLSQTNSSTTGIGAGAFSIANDNAGNAWVAGYSGNNLIKLNSSGVVQSGSAGYTTGSPSGPYGVALDSYGNIWTANYNNSSLTKFTSAGAGTNVSGSAGGISGPYGLAIDGANSVWVLNNTTMSVSEYSYNGTTATAVTSTTGYYGGTSSRTPQANGGLFAIALDISGNIWVANLDDSATDEFVGAAAPVVSPLALAVKNNTLGTRP